MKEHGYVTLPSRSVGAVLGDLDVSTDAAWSTGHSAIHSLVTWIFFSCVCLMASMARSVNCHGQKNAVQVHLIGAEPIVQVKR